MGRAFVRCRDFSVQKQPVLGQKGPSMRFPNMTLLRPREAPQVVITNGFLVLFNVRLGSVRDSGRRWKAVRYLSRWSERASVLRAVRSGLRKPSAQPRGTQAAQGRPGPTMAAVRRGGSPSVRSGPRPGSSHSSCSFLGRGFRRVGEGRSAVHLKQKQSVFL